MYDYYILYICTDLVANYFQFKIIKYSKEVSMQWHVGLIGTVLEKLC